MKIRGLVPQRSHQRYKTKNWEIPIRRKAATTTRGLNNLTMAPGRGVVAYFFSAVIMTAHALLVPSHVLSQPGIASRQRPKRILVWRGHIRCSESVAGEAVPEPGERSPPSAFSVDLEIVGSASTPTIEKAEERTPDDVAGAAEASSLSNGMAAAAAAATTVAVAAKVAGAFTGRVTGGAAGAAAAGAAVAGAASVVDATMKNGTVSQAETPAMVFDDSADTPRLVTTGDWESRSAPFGAGELSLDRTQTEGFPEVADVLEFERGAELSMGSMNSAEETSLAAAGDASQTKAAAAAAAAATTVVVAAKVAGVVSGAAVAAAAGAAAASAAGVNLKNVTRDSGGQEDESDISAPTEVSVAMPPTESIKYPSAGTTALPPAVAIRPFTGLRDDILRRWPSYGSDWADGFQPKTVSAVMLLYVACLAPTVSFGGLSAVLTDGNIGVVEFLVSHGVSGIIYAVVSGQPMTFIAPTGLTLAFMAALYRFAGLAALPFLPLYGWVGIWTASMLTFLALGGFAMLIEFCTSFTDDVFNALLALNFLVEACKSLARGFIEAGPDKTSPFLSLNFAILTCYTSLQLNQARTSKLFTKSIREAISDFGPILVILATSVLSLLPVFKSLGMEFLQVPAVRQLAGGRQLFLPLGVVPIWARWGAALPAVLLTVLFYLDHLISVRVVNAPRHRMKKGTAYNQDLFALGAIVALQSICGMPWMCGATVQSLNHIRAMATYGKASEYKALDAEKPIDAESAIGDSRREVDERLPARSTVLLSPPAPTPPKGELIEGLGGLAGGLGGSIDTEGENGSLERALPTKSRREGSERSRLALAKIGRAMRRTMDVFLGTNLVSESESLGSEQGDHIKPKAWTPETGDEKELQIISVVETRLSGLVLHSMILSSVLLLPFLQYIPMPVIYGIFLYLGRKVRAQCDFYFFFPCCT